MIDKAAGAEQASSVRGKNPNEAVTSSAFGEPAGIEDIEYVQKLLSALQDESTFDAARERLYGYLYSDTYREVAVHNLFRAVRFRSTKGLQDMTVLKDVFKNLFLLYNELNEKPEPLTDAEHYQGYETARVIDQFTDELGLIYEMGDEVDGNVNYLALRYAQGFADEVGSSQSDPMIDDMHISAHIDADTYLPFEIEPGRLAMFSKDKREIYLISPDESAAIIPRLVQAAEGLDYTVTDTATGSYTTPLVPPAIYEYVQYIRSHGTSLREVLADRDKDEVSRYQTLQHTHVTELLEKDFSQSVRNLSLREKLHLYNYLAASTIKSVGPVRQFTEDFGATGMRTFLSLERGGITGDQIVDFGSESEKAAAIFEYYCLLLDRADQAEVIVRQEYDGEEDIETIVAEVRQLILERAHKALVQAVVEGKEMDILEIVKTANIDSVGIPESYITLKRAGLVQNVEDMRSVEKEQYSGEEIEARPDIMEKVATLFHERWSPEDAAVRLTSLNEHLKEPGATLTVEFLRGRLIATLLTEEREDGSVYVGSLNATGDHHLQSLRIGSSLVGPVVESYAAAEKTIESTSLFDTAVSYINGFGFSAVAILEPNQATGEARVRLIRNDSWSLRSKTMKRSELIARIGGTEDVEILVKPVENEGAPPVELTSGYVLTKRLRHGGQQYNVLERFAVPT